jgi:hypothetical protein
MFLTSAHLSDPHLHSCDTTESKKPQTVAWNVDRD